MAVGARARGRMAAKASPGPAWCERVGVHVSAYGRVVLACSPVGLSWVPAAGLLAFLLFVACLSLSLSSPVAPSLCSPALPPPPLVALPPAVSPLLSPPLLGLSLGLRSALVRSHYV